MSRKVFFSILWSVLVLFGAEAKAFNVAVGAGGFFLEPHELSGPARKPLAVFARPLLMARGEFSLLKERGFFEPQLGALFPKETEDGATSLGAFLNTDLGYRIGSRWVALGGIGALFNATSFLTPDTTVVGWLFTVNGGMAFWLDSRLRLEVETLAARLFDPERRRLRFLVGMAYVL